MEHATDVFDKINRESEKIDLAPRHPHKACPKMNLLGVPVWRFCSGFLHDISFLKSICALNTPGAQAPEALPDVVGLTYSRNCGISFGLCNRSPIGSLLLCHQNTEHSQLKDRHFSLPQKELRQNIRSVGNYRSDTHCGVSRHRFRIVYRPYMDISFQ
jgi:hypothetical protein